MNPVESEPKRSDDEEPVEATRTTGSQDVRPDARSGRRMGHSTPIRPKSAPLAKMTPLVAPLVLSTSAGYRYRLVASSPTEGLLEPLTGAPPFRSNAPWQLIPQEPGLRTVRAVVQALPTSDAEPLHSGIRVCWLAITATERRAFLVEALERMLGVRAKVCVLDDRLGPHRKLVYHPRAMRVELVQIVKGVTTRSSDGNAPAVSAGAGEPRPGASRSERPTSRPFVLVDNGSMGDDQRAMLESGRYKVASRRTLSSWAGKTLKTEAMQRPVTLRRERRQAKRTVVRCAKNRGCFTHAGQVWGMNCGWLGSTHLVFETVEAASRGLAVGTRVSVGVAGSPLYSQIVWVSGDVSEIKQLPSGRVSVEVDLRCLTQLPRPYAELVKHWRSLADASSNP